MIQAPPYPFVQEGGKLAYAAVIGLHMYLSLTCSSETESRGFLTHNLHLLA